MMQQSGLIYAGLSWHVEKRSEEFIYFNNVPFVLCDAVVCAG